MKTALILSMTEYMNHAVSKNKIINTNYHRGALGSRTSSNQVLTTLAEMIRQAGQGEQRRYHHIQITAGSRH